MTMMMMMKQQRVKMKSLLVFSPHHFSYSLLYLNEMEKNNVYDHNYSRRGERRRQRRRRRRRYNNQRLVRTQRGNSPTTTHTTIIFYMHISVH